MSEKFRRNDPINADSANALMERLDKLEAYNNQLTKAAKELLPVAEEAMNTLQGIRGMIPQDMAKKLGKPTFALRRAIEATQPR